MLHPYLGAMLSARDGSFQSNLKWSVFHLSVRIGIGLILVVGQEWTQKMLILALCDTPKTITRCISKTLRLNTNICGPCLSALSFYFLSVDATRCLPSSHCLLAVRVCSWSQYSQIYIFTLPPFFLCQPDRSPATAHQCRLCWELWVKSGKTFLWLIPSYKV